MDYEKELENSKVELKDQLLKLMFTVFILLPISLIVGGYITKYLWNGIISPTFSLPGLTLIQGIGLDTFVSFIIPKTTSNSSSVTDTVARIVVVNLFYLAIGAIIMLFI